MACSFAGRRLRALESHVAPAATEAESARLRAQALVKKEQAEAAQQLADEEQANLQGGFGRLQTDTSGYFTLNQQAEALEFFRGNGVSAPETTLR